MEVSTTRFGIIEVKEDRFITFPRGLLGFPQHTRFCLLQPGDEACFFWLQSLDDPSLAFVVTDPSLFVGEYAVQLRTEQATTLGIKDTRDAQVLSIVNKVGDQLTANLQGPLVINTLSRVGEQIVVADRRWTTRHALMRVGQPSTERAAPGATAEPKNIEQEVHTRAQRVDPALALTT